MTSDEEILRNYDVQLERLSYKRKGMIPDCDVLSLMKLAREDVLGKLFTTEDNINKTNFSELTRKWLALIQEKEKEIQTLREQNVRQKKEIRKLKKR